MVTQASKKWTVPFLRLSFTLLLVTAATFAQGAGAAGDNTGAQLRVSILEGEGAINNIKQRTSRDAIVQVTDENDRPVAGAVITFTLPGRGPSGVFANGAKSVTVVADSQGMATATGITPNSVAGDFTIQVSASHQGQTASTTIAQSNAAGAAGVSGATVGILAAVATAAAVGAVVALGGGDGGPAPGPVITPPPAGTSVTLGGSTVGRPR